MSKGVIDEEWAASCREAIAIGQKTGKKPRLTDIYHNADGSRSFRWRFDPIGREAPPPSMTHDPDDFEKDVRRRVTRGVRSKPAQGALDLPD